MKRLTRGLWSSSALTHVDANFQCLTMSTQVDRKSTAYAWNLRLFATCANLRECWMKHVKRFQQDSTRTIEMLSKFRRCDQTIFNMLSTLLEGHIKQFQQILSSYYSWACSSAVFAWKRGIWVIVLKRNCLCIKYSNVLAILSYSWLILPIVRHCTAYGCSNRSNKVRWEN